MIKVIQTRDKDGSSFDLGTTDRSVMKAFKLLLECELKFGAEVIDLNQTSLTVQTNVWNCIDTTTFSGSAEDMKCLWESAAIYTVLKSQLHVPEIRDQVVKRIMEFTGGLPILVNLSTGLIVGSSLIQSTIVVLLSLEDMSQVEQVSNRSYEELLTMLEWKVVDKLSLQEIIELAA